MTSTDSDAAMAQGHARLDTFDEWLYDARSRAQEFSRDGPRAPVTWVLAERGDIPRGALVGGSERNEPLFIARTFHDGGIRAYLPLHYRTGMLTHCRGRQGVAQACARVRLRVRIQRN